MKRVFTPITLAIAVPLLTLLVLTASVVLPGYFIVPKYDFVYTVQDYTATSIGSYSVRDGVITYSPFTYNDPSAPIVDDSKTSTNLPKMYRYSMKNDTSTDITLEEANALSLNENVKSKDGFIFERSYRNYGLLSMGSSSANDSYVLAGRGVSRVVSNINLPSSGSAQFLAWIE